MFSAAGRETFVHSPPAWAPGARGTTSGGRLRGLDGLRALAITGVVFYHGDLSWLPGGYLGCLLYTSPSPRDRQKSRMPSSA